MTAVRGLSLKNSKTLLRLCGVQNVDGSMFTVLSSKRHREQIGMDLTHHKSIPRSVPNPIMRQ